MNQTISHYALYGAAWMQLAVVGIITFENYVKQGVAYVRYYFA